MTATITPPTERRAEPKTAVGQPVPAGSQMALAIGGSIMHSQRLLRRVGWVGLMFFAIKGVAWIVLAVTALLLAGR